MAIEETQFKPATLVSTDESSDAEYIYADVKAPIMSGFAIKAFAWTLENRVGGPLLLNYLKKANLVTRVFIDSHYHEVPMHIPRFSIKVHEQPAVHQVDHELSSCDRLASAVNCLASSSNSDSQEHFHRWTIQDYSKAYSAKRITPLMVAERCLQAIQDSCKSKPDMGFFISCYEADVLRQAEESTDRFKKGKPLSILDGIPIAIKDEIDCLPYPTTGGTKWLSKVRAVKDDADCVKQLRNCGAILLGKTNMHELGLGTTGINPHYGASRNPYDRRKFSGGSSGGSAATVAAGLCPVSLGVDGGGSVRIPSALCGVVGLKGTFGRVSPSGVLPLNWTLGMTGIHAATVEDALLVYAVIHGHPSAEHTVSQPPALHLPILKELEGLQGDSMIGAIRFAKYTKWFEHCDASIAEGCYKVLGLLEQHYGCKVIEVTVPEIEEMRLAHYVTIACECNTSLGLDYTKLGKMQSGFDTRAAFAIYKGFNNREFLAAQRMRSRQMHYHSEIFKKADFIVTPATACTAQLINPSALETGELNYIDGAKLMRYQIAANVLGLPAITVPVGYDSTGMPMGIHLLGPPWSEAAMLRVAFVIEKLLTSEHRWPETFYDLLA